MKTELQKLRDKLDRVFSKYIRQKDAVDGIARCITCGRFQEWKYIQCGHFQSRRYLATRWEEKNCAPQCKDCNLFNQGKQDEFGRKIEEKYGKETLEMLRIKKNNIMKLDKFEYQALISIYQIKLKAL